MRTKGPFSLQSNPNHEGNTSFGDEPSSAINVITTDNYQGLCVKSIQADCKVKQHLKDAKRILNSLLGNHYNYNFLITKMLC